MKKLLTGVISLTRVLHHRIFAEVFGDQSGYSILKVGLLNTKSAISFLLTFLMLS